VLTILSFAEGKIAFNASDTKDVTEGYIFLSVLGDSKIKWLKSLVCISYLVLLLVDIHHKQIGLHNKMDKSCMVYHK
jgi:hypothetical protein